MYYAAGNGDYKFCDYLLKLGADPNVGCGEEFSSATHMAFSSNNAEVIRLFIQKKANLNKCNFKKQTPLAFAKKSTLELLGLEEGQAIVQGGHKFDNHLLLDSFTNLDFLDNRAQMASLQLF